MMAGNTKVLRYTKKYIYTVCCSINRQQWNNILNSSEMKKQNKSITNKLMHCQTA